MSVCPRTFERENESGACRGRGKGLGRRCPAPSHARHRCLRCPSHATRGALCNCGGALCNCGGRLRGGAEVDPGLRNRCSVQARTRTPRPPLPAPSRTRFCHQNTSAENFGTRVHAGGAGWGANGYPTSVSRRTVC